MKEKCLFSVFDLLWFAGFDDSGCPRIARLSGNCSAAATKLDWSTHISRSMVAGVALEGYYFQLVRAQNCSSYSFSSSKM